MVMLSCFLSAFVLFFKSAISDGALVFSFSICLEWNGLGMLENSFAAFCDGLAANSTLRALDLRNNQINHDGAEELSAALKRNITLRALGRNPSIFGDDDQPKYVQIAKKGSY